MATYPRKIPGHGIGSQSECDSQAKDDIELHIEGLFEWKMRVVVLGKNGCSTSPWDD